MTTATDLERYFLNLVNGERALAGLSSVQMELNLNAAADNHSQWMTDADTFNHIGVDGSAPSQRMDDAGYDFARSWRATENIAAVSVSGTDSYLDEVDRLHTNLMNSPGHRENILDANVTSIGIGLAFGSLTYSNGVFDSVFVTQNFARTLGTEDLDIWGNGGSNTLSGDVGNDHLDGQGGADVLRGAAGNDTIEGGSGADMIAGGSGNDQIRGGTDNDRIFGGSGNDTLRGESGDNRVDGGSGTDRVFGGSGDDTLSGGSGADLLVGSGGNDRVTGGTAEDTLYGNAGNDTLNGEDGGDWLSGGRGDDLLLGREGNDTMRGSGDDDRLFGHDNDDLLAGNSGDDSLYGGTGNDRLFRTALMARGAIQS
jgi:serralysin